MSSEMLEQIQELSLMALDTSKRPAEFRLINDDQADPSPVRTAVTFQLPFSKVDGFPQLDVPLKRPNRTGPKDSLQLELESWDELSDEALIRFEKDLDSE